MGIVMKGAEAAKAIKEELTGEVADLKAGGIKPCLAIIRVGARPDDLAYERGARKRMETSGIECRVTALPEDIGQKELEQEFSKVNADPCVHGILLLRPLPGTLDEEPLKAMIDPQKDVDGMSPVNIARVFSGDETGFAPCTAEAVMEMLRHYRIEIRGKRVTVLGRSMIVERTCDGYHMSYADGGYCRRVPECRDPGRSRRKCADGDRRDGGEGRRRRRCGY